MALLDYTLQGTYKAMWENSKDTNETQTSN